MEIIKVCPTKIENNFYLPQLYEILQDWLQVFPIEHPSLEESLCPCRFAWFQTCALLYTIYNQWKHPHQAYHE